MNVQVMRMLRPVLIAGVFLEICAGPALADGTRMAESNRYGVVNDHRATSPAAIKLVRDAGFGWVHYVLYWNLTNPAPGVYDWVLPDIEIQRMADAGLNIYVRIAFPPTWTTGATYPNSALYYCYAPPGGPLPDVKPPYGVRDDDDNNCKDPSRRPGFRAQYPPGYDRSQDFREFVAAAVTRYQGKVQAWGFGFEAHSPVFWLGRNEELFDEVLRPGYETVKSIDPRLLVVGPDEDHLDTDPKALGNFEYLVNLENVRGLRAFDVLSFHFLSQTYRDSSALQARLRPVVERIRRGRPFWLTEMGYQGDNGGDESARDWLAGKLSEIAASPWIDKTFIYRLQDAIDPDFGLLNEDTTPKPAYTAIQQFLSTQATPRFYYLAEGATKSLFDMDVAIANPNDIAAPVKVSFLKPDGTVVLQTPTLAPKSRVTLRVDTIGGIENADVSTVVESTTGVPLAVERTMFWDSGAYGGHTDTAVQAPATKWYFAEGAQGFFTTYVLLANSNIVPATVHVTFLLQGLPPVEKTLTVGPTARGQFCTCDYEELANQSFGVLVESDQPIIAERAMYFGSVPFWTAGHESAGVTAPATNWFMAEGATGPFFDLFVLLSNPNDEEATLNVEFITSNGDTFRRPLGIPGKSRYTIYVDAEPGLEDAKVSTRISADLPVVAERAMYWPGTPDQWYEAHNSFGLTETGTRWVLAEGRTGNAGRAGTDPGFESYILVYNTSDAPTNFTVTYLLEDGGAFTVPYSSIPKGRLDVTDSLTDPRLANRSYGALIESDQPIVVERAMYWRGTTGRPWGWGGSNAPAMKLQ